MSRKLEVLQMLKDAGERGVRSDEFYRRFNGRGVARVFDLKQEGYVIEAEPEGKYKRYRLQGRRGVETSKAYADTKLIPNRLDIADRPGGEEPGGKTEVLAVAPEGERSVPSMFDLDADWS